MADKSARVPENVPGPWYVDNACTPCRVCMDVPLATNFLKFKDGDSNNYVYFYRVPEGEVEVQAAEETMAVCPQNAIGNDG